jgi:multidrug resistance efflux pump
MGEYRTTTGEPLPEGRRVQRERRRKWIRRSLWIAAAVFAAGFAAPVPHRVAATGYVTTDQYAEVRPAVAGTVEEILVRSGQRVRKGDVLAHLDGAALRASMEEARHAALRAAADVERRAAQLEEQRRRREHLLAAAKIRLDHAEATLKLTEDLQARGLTSGKALEDRKTDLDLARTEWQRIRDENDRAAERELEVLRRELDVREAAARAAEARWNERRIIAPIDGEAVRYEFVVGELVTPDHVLYELFGGDRLILKLRIPERDVALVAPGTAYKARLSMYPGLTRRRFRGTVESLRSVIQTDRQTKYRMAYCTFDDRGLAVPPGTTAEARLDAGRLPFWLWLFGAY